MTTKRRIINLASETSYARSHTACVPGVAWLVRRVLSRCDAVGSASGLPQQVETSAKRSQLLTFRMTEKLDTTTDCSRRLQQPCPRFPEATVTSPEPRQGKVRLPGGINPCETRMHIDAQGSGTVTTLGNWAPAATFSVRLPRGRTVNALVHGWQNRHVGLMTPAVHPGSAPLPDPLFRLTPRNSSW